MKIIIIDNLLPLFIIIRLFPPPPPPPPPPTHTHTLYTYAPIHFSKIDMTTKNTGGFIRFPPLFRGRWCHGISAQFTTYHHSSPNWLPYLQYIKVTKKLWTSENMHIKTRWYSFSNRFLNFIAVIWMILFCKSGYLFDLVQAWVWIIELLYQFHPIASG